MSGFIGALLEGIVDFVTDIWVLRRQRAANGRAANSWSEDAADTAVFNAWVIGLSILALAAGSIMVFVLKLPLWMSFGPVVAVGVYVVWHFRLPSRSSLQRSPPAGAKPLRRLLNLQRLRPGRCRAP